MGENWQQSKIYFLLFPTPTWKSIWKKSDTDTFSTRPLSIDLPSDTAILLLSPHLFKKNLLKTYRILDIMLGT